MEKLEEKADGKTEFSMLSMMNRVTMDIIGKVPAVPFFFPLQLAGRDGSNAYQQQDGIRSWRQGERPLPSSARRPAGLIVPLPFRPSHGKGQLGKGLHKFRCGLKDGDPLQKSFQPHTSLLSMPKGTQPGLFHGCRLYYCHCISAGSLPYIGFSLSMQTSLGGMESRSKLLICPNKEKT